MTEQDFCVKLVQAVEKYPCLYNYKLPDYSRKDVVDKAWKEVGKEVNEESGKCKDKWRNIRIVFMRHLKFGLSGGKRKKPYYLNDMMQFIIPFLNPVTANISNNIPSASVKNQNTETEDTGIGNGGTDVDDVTVDNEPPFTQSVEEELKRKMNVNDVSMSNKKKKQEMSESNKFFVAFCNSQPNKEKEDDPKKAFLTSLLPDLHSLNDQEMRQFKRRVLALIDEIIDNRPTSAHSNQTHILYEEDSLPIKISPDLLKID